MNDLGRDPLSEQWVAAFSVAHGRPLNDVDRQDHLFSLMFPGRGPGQAWTEEDLVTYRANKRALWAGTMCWPVGDVPFGYGRFAHHFQRLARHYGPGHEAATKFTRAAGLIWGGIAYEGSAFKALFRAGAGRHSPQMHEGPVGWRPEHVDDANPTHHWVAAFVAGFAYGALFGAVTNSVRDLAQLLTGLGGTMADIRLGNLAARHGAFLRRASRDAATQDRPYDALMAVMNHDLQGDA